MVFNLIFTVPTAALDHAGRIELKRKFKKDKERK